MIQPWFGGRNSTMRVQFAERAKCDDVKGRRFCAMSRGEASPSSHRAGRSAYALMNSERFGGQPPREVRAEAGEPPRNRTENPQIKSLLLCQLS